MTVELIGYGVESVQVVGGVEAGDPLLTMLAQAEIEATVIPVQGPTLVLVEQILRSFGIDVSLASGLEVFVAQLDRLAQAA